MDTSEGDTNWLTAPASTRFHLNREGGLLEHSVGVTETLLRVRESLAPGISEESCVIVGLLHDVGKVGMPGKPNYLRNTVDWEIKRMGKTYTNNPELVYMGLAQRSLYLIAKYIPLSDSEAQAVLYHDGLYVEGNKEVGGRESPLLLLLHFADLWTARVYEEGVTPKEDLGYYERKADK
jgi:hypothetical protein